MIQRETSASAHEPVRTCVGCRRRELATDLIRVVAMGGSGIVVDDRRRLPGRGAWLHPSAECFHQAVRRRAFARALRITGNPDTASVSAYIEDVSEYVEKKATQNMSTP